MEAWVHHLAVGYRTVVGVSRQFQYDPRDRRGHPCLVFGALACLERVQRILIDGFALQQRLLRDEPLVIELLATFHLALGIFEYFARGFQACSKAGIFAGDLRYQLTHFDF